MNCRQLQSGRPKVSIHALSWQISCHMFTLFTQDMVLVQDMLQELFCLCKLVAAMVYCAINDPVQSRTNWLPYSRMLLCA